jgi:hypothetical protein
MKERLIYERVSYRLAWWKNSSTLFFHVKRAKKKYGKTLRNAVVQLF